VNWREITPADGGGEVLAEVVGAFDADERIEREQTPRLLVQQFVLSKKLNRPVVRAMDRDLGSRPEAVTQLEANLSRAVEPEQVREEVTDVPRGDRPGKAMGEAESKLA
jgi:hypothetical protein